MKRKNMLGVGIILFLALAGIGLASLWGRKLDLHYVEQLHAQEEFLYYVDRGMDDSFRIIRSDTEGGQGVVIRCPRYEDTKYRVIRQLFFGEAKEVYALVEEIGTTSLRTVKRSVFYCDFEKGQLQETGYTLSDSDSCPPALSRACVTGCPDGDTLSDTESSPMRSPSDAGDSEKGGFPEQTEKERNIFVQRMEKGKLYYFETTGVKDEEAEVSLCVMDQKGSVERLDQIWLKYSGLKMQYFFSRNEMLLWMDQEGRISAKKVGDETPLQIEGMPDGATYFRSLSDDDQWAACVVDYESDCIRRISLREQRMDTVYSAEDIRKQKPDFTFGDCAGMDCTEDGFYAAMKKKDTDGKVRLCVYQDGTYREIRQIILNGGSLIRRMLPVYAGIVFLAVLLCLYWYVYCKYRVQTILVRLLLVFLLGLFVADHVLEGWIEETIRQQLEKNQTLAMTILGEQLRKEILTGLETKDRGEKQGVLLKPEQMIHLGIKEEEKESTEPMNYTYSIFAASESGGFVIEESMTEYKKVPDAWCCSAENQEALKTSYETGKCINRLDENESGKWNRRFLPLLLSDGTRYGVLSVSFEGNLLDYQIWKYQKNLRAVSALLFLALTVLLLLLLVLFLRPLKKLKETAEKLSAGELGLTVPVRGHDEIANISAAFNQMSMGIAQHVQEIQEMSDGYYKFIPAKILELLGKESIQQVELGDQMTGQMTVLSLCTSGDARQKQIAGNTYRELNQILETPVTVITAHQGVVEHFEEAGLSAFFTESSEEALRAAIEIQRLPDERQKEISGAGLMRDGRTIALTYGQVTIGVIGNGNRMEAATISMHSALAKALRLKGETYGARILLTHFVYRQIPDFEKTYHARYLGNVYLRANDTLERIYDVYDGDAEEDFYQKELTRPLFEQGVELFVAKKFYEARLVFVEVLKQYRRDRAAKAYLYRCDKYYKSADVENVTTALEQF